MGSWKIFRRGTRGLKSLGFFGYLLSIGESLKFTPLLAHKYLTDFYQRTLFGFLWVVFRVSFTTIAIILILGQLEIFQDGSLPYSIVVSSGMALWIAFDIGLIKGSRAMMQLVRIWSTRWTPMPIFPLSFNIIPIAFMVIFLPLPIVIFAYHYEYFALFDEHWALRIPLAIASVILTLAFLTTINLVTGPLFLISRDVRFMMPLFKNILLFATPIVYPASLLPPDVYRVAIWVNPLTGVVETWRTALFGSMPFDPANFAWSTFLVLTLLTMALMFNLRLEGILARISRI